MHDSYTKVWRPEHLAEVPEHVPETVKAEILAVIKTLNQYYGEDRDVDEDLGGAMSPSSQRHTRRQTMKPYGAGITCVRMTGNMQNFFAKREKYSG